MRFCSNYISLLALASCAAMINCGGEEEGEQDLVDLSILELDDVQCVEPQRSFDGVDPTTRAVKRTPMRLSCSVAVTGAFQANQASLRKAEGNGRGYSPYSLSIKATLRGTSDLQLVLEMKHPNLASSKTVNFSYAEPASKSIVVL